ncbi:MAG TPA: hypothetical protein V6D18_21545 [Thermosynechococcaceae cyanobacterium]
MSLSHQSIANRNPNKTAMSESSAFKVVTPRSTQEFDRWIDALNAAKSLVPQCRSLTEDIRIYLLGDLVWIYSRSHKYPQYIGAGMYDKLARLFVQETIEQEAIEAEERAANPSDREG